MTNFMFIHNTIVNKLHLRWASHYSRVTGKPVPSGLSFTIYNSITQVSKDAWDNANGKKDIFLSSSYLTALEQAPPENMSFRYAIISKEAVPIGIAYFQILELNYRLHQPPIHVLAAKKKSFLQNIHNKIIDTATLRLLVCGNVMLSGEHGFSMATSANNTAMHVIGEIAYAIRKASDPHITVTMAKDFYKQEWSQTNILSKFGYYQFDAGPNMVVPIRKTWATFDNYLNEMKPKYRKRAISAMKKGSSIIRKSLDLDELIRYKEDVFALYCQVLNKAKFKIFFLSPHYFVELKRHLGGKFVCEGYFLNSIMIGFTTRIYNGDILEGYAHGLVHERNKEFELYQNFLLDDVKAAIDAKISYINTGRTSVAMKSSIGAVPKDMVCAMRFSSRHSNQIVRPLFYFIKPSNEYCRNPFEEEQGM
jgi:predicted N-acyltransferase